MRQRYEIAALAVRKSAQLLARAGPKLWRYHPGAGAGSRPFVITKKTAGSSVLAAFVCF
jgi:hypothetical protein